MPTYDYRCETCGQHCEVRHSMSEMPPPPLCPDCGSNMKRWIYSAPAIHGGAARGREQAARSLPHCGKGCRCCP